MQVKTHQSQVPVILRKQSDVPTELAPYHVLVLRYQIFKQIFELGFPIELYRALAQ